MAHSSEQHVRQGDAWPALPLAAWRATRDTLHMWTQMVGKVKLALAPPQNHWWQVAMYLSSLGLTTGPMPCGDRTIEILFDLADHGLVVTSSDGSVKAMPLLPRTVASFHHELLAVLRALHVDVHLWPVPVEVPNPIPFDEDHEHAAYDPFYVTRWWRVLLQADAALRTFAGRFQGKQSPVHFFWGSFDLAGTRFSGRPAPERAGADRVTREAYSHEVMSFGFWPGGGPVDDAAFYAYAAPEPAGFREAALGVRGARYLPELGEFILPYADVRTSDAPMETVLQFFQQAYEAGATLGAWDRPALDRPWQSAPSGTHAGSATMVAHTTPHP